MNSTRNKRRSRVRINLKESSGITNLFVVGKSRVATGNRVQFPYKRVVKLAGCFFLPQLIEGGHSTHGIPRPVIQGRKLSRHVDRFRTTFCGIRDADLSAKYHRADVVVRITMPSSKCSVPLLLSSAIITCHGYIVLETGTIETNGRISSIIFFGDSHSSFHPFSYLTHYQSVRGVDKYYTTLPS